MLDANLLGFLATADVAATAVMASAVIRVFIYGKRCILAVIVQNMTILSGYKIRRYNRCIFRLQMNNNG